MEKQRERHMEQRKGQRVILFPLPLQGHLNSMLQLANLLYSKGFSITIIHTHFNSPNPEKHPNFTFPSIPDGLNNVNATQLASSAIVDDVIVLLSLLNTNYVKPFSDCLSELLFSSSSINNVSDHEEPIACLINDAVWHFSQAVADHLRIPRLVILWTSSVSSFVGFTSIPFPLEKDYVPIKAQLEDPVPELPPLRVKDLPVYKTRNPEDFYALISFFVKETNASAGIIWNTFEQLEEVALTKQRREVRIPMFPIGPLHKQYYGSPTSSTSLLVEDPTSISWLNKKTPNSVLYVSFGSLATIKETEFLEVAWGLANSNRPFLWVVRLGLVSGSEWIEPLPNVFMEMVGGRGKIVKWAPHQEVLANPATEGFWTHSGWNSTLESMCEGVPMICMPFSGDQMVNGRYVSHVWRVGVRLEQWRKRSEIDMAIRRVMLESEGHEMREQVFYWKEKLNNCVRLGGTAYNYLDSLASYILSL